MGVITLAGFLCLSVTSLQLASSAPNAQVQICHATGSETNPYSTVEPTIGNNGDLQGGHLSHTGPVFVNKTVTPDWGDIIPPYEYIDENGDTRTFPGYNWSPEGQAIWQNDCTPGLKPLTPFVECVSVGRRGHFFAHFGYVNPNDVAVVAPFTNTFSPAPEDRGQPTLFHAGRVNDAVQVASAVPVTWSLGGNTATASRDSTRCQGTITLVKVLNPSNDDGLFSFKIGGQLVLSDEGETAVGDGGTTGTIAVNTGRHSVGESAGPGTSLDGYDTRIDCVNGSGAPVGESTTPSVRVRVRKDEDVLCTITNTRKGKLEPVVPTLDCVVFRSGAPDTAVWGYRNENAFPVAIPVGGANGFAPAPQDRTQPQVFEAGTWPGVVQTAFGGSPTVSWTLDGQTVTASASSPPCTATVEVKKVTVPPNDPGVFNLVINGQVHATGGNGTTTGPVTVGAGEATVSETPGPSTTLTDYATTIDCTRNGTPIPSATGTKLDVETAQGDVVVCTFTNQHVPNPATMEVRKVTVPANDPGVFNLLVNGQAHATGGNGTTTGAIAVGAGVATAGETAGPGTTLADYQTTIDCTRNGTHVASVTGTTADVATAPGDVVVCTFTNQRSTTPPIPPTPDDKVDLAIQKSATPTTVLLGQKITWTVTVTNKSSVDASDVNVVKVSEHAHRTKLISLKPSQGTCSVSTGCNLGRLPAGASATIIAVTRATQTGVIPNVVRVGSEEQETDYTNNVASNIVRVVGPFRPPLARQVCHTLGAAPRVLRHGTSSVVLTSAKDRFGVAVPGVLVRMSGPGVHGLARTNARGIARFAVTPSRQGFVYFSGRLRANAAAGTRCSTFLGVLGARAGFVTG